MADLPSTEHRDLLSALALHRRFLITTADGLSDDQARATPTVSTLSVGGLIKHVAATEHGWVTFIVEGAPGYDSTSEYGPAEFTMAPDQSLADVLENYAAVAARTESVIGSLDDLNVEQPLPEAPWFPPGTAWTARRVVLHLIAETSQHAGHADIIRESIDGAKTMG